MLAKDDLYKLVKAMSRSEKRYFSLDAQKSGKKGSRYLELFRVLNEMDVYDDERLKKKFPRGLSSDKAYLYEAVLRSMRDYRSPRSKAAQIKERIQDSRYLFERGLYKLCDERLREANDIAKELGDELMILEVARERLLTIKGNRDKHFVKYVEDLLTHQDTAFDNVKQFFKYSGAYYRMIAKVTKNFHLPSEQKEKISLPDFFNIDKDIVLSPQTERRYLQSLALHSQLIGDKEKVLEYFIQTVDWWNKNKAFKSEEYFRYISDVFNMIYAFIANEKFTEAGIHLNAIKAEEPVLTHEKRVWFESLYLHQLMLLLNQKDYQKAKNLVGEIDEGLVKNGLTNNNILSCNISILYFLLGDYEKSQMWSAKIINASRSTLRKDIQILVRVLNLISIFETEEIEQVENAIRSVSRYFKVNGIINTSFEYKLLQKLSGLFKCFPNETGEKKSDLYDFLSGRYKTEGSRDDIIEPLLEWLEPVKVFAK